MLPMGRSELACFPSTSTNRAVAGTRASSYVEYGFSFYTSSMQTYCRGVQHIRAVYSALPIHAAQTSSPKKTHASKNTQVGVRDSVAKHPVVCIGAVRRVSSGVLHLSNSEVRCGPVGFQLGAMSDPFGIRLRLVRRPSATHSGRSGVLQRLVWENVVVDRRLIWIRSGSVHGPSVVHLGANCGRSDASVGSGRAQSIALVGFIWGRRVARKLPLIAWPRLVMPASL